MIKDLPHFLTRTGKRCQSSYWPTLLAIVMGAASSYSAQAQEKGYTNYQKTKIAVASESMSEQAKRYTSSKVMVLAQADRQTPRALPVNGNKTGVELEDDKQRKLVTNGIEARVAIAQQPDRLPVKPEKIPGLTAAKIPPFSAGNNDDEQPVYVSGDFIDGYADTKVVVRGRGQLIREETVLQGEELTYNRQSEVATADDDVRMNRNGNIFLGQHAQLHVPTSQGYFSEVNYWIAQTGAHGNSEQLEFASKEQMTLFRANYTLCEARPGGNYDWELKASRVDLDFDKDEGVAKNAVLRFMDVPILASPWMSFPLSDKRRSGFLVPTFGMDSDSGFTYSQPYYWNIAPNYDATLTPLYMSKRGLGLQGEFRYLHSNDTGTFRGLFLPNDRNFDKENRWAYSWQHEYRLSNFLPILGNIQFRTDLNRVSDHQYWEDFPKMSDSLTSRLLNNEGTFSSDNNGFSTFLRVQRWQTMQSKDAYSTPPFDRTQMRLSFQKEDIHGFDFSIIGDHTRFKADRHSSYLRYLEKYDSQAYFDTLKYSNGWDKTDTIYNNDVDSKRSVLHTSLSFPIRKPGWFIVPKAQLISRYYDFDSPVKNMLDQKRVDDMASYYQISSDFKKANIRTMKHKSVTVPTFSLDTGLIFERKASLFGKDYLQTLEPRAMYVYTPYRDQSMLPVYDSGAFDYNLASLYLENPYSGYDRIADTHMVIFGVGTRWQNPATGAEALSLNIAQRYRFKDQRVTLNNDPISRHQGDWLFSAGTELVRNWRFDALVQYNPDEKQTQHSIMRIRWRPGAFRVMNLSYRMVRKSEVADDNTSGAEQVDFNWQWPLGSPWMGSNLPELSKRGGRWYSVGRINYSLRDKKLVDGIFGLEYQSCCWVARGVLEKKSTGRTKATTGFLFQLELTGLSRIGVDPLRTLRDSIDHYQTIRSEQIIRRRDFELYD